MNPTVIDELTAWLDHPNYEAGVLLYQRHVGTGFLLTLFKQGADDYNRDQLHAKLSDHLAQLTAEQVTLQASYPEPLTSDLSDAGKLMDERTILKERMRVQINSGINKSQALKDMAFRILAIKDELDTIYSRKDFFERHGYLPHVDPPAEEARPAYELTQLRNNLRSNITKTNAKLKTAYGPQETKLKAKLEAFLTQLHDIDQQLDSAHRP